MQLWRVAYATVEGDLCNCRGWPMLLWTMVYVTVDDGRIVEGVTI